MATNTLLKLTVRNAGTFKELAEAGTECFIVGTSGLFNLDEDLTVAWDKMIENFNACVNA